VNALDYVLLGIVAVSVVTAATKGFVYEVWMMIAAVAAVVAAAWQFPAVAPWLNFLDNPEAQNFAAFALVLLAVLIAAMIAGRMMRGAVRAVGLGGMDRVLGAGLGLVRGLLFAVALVAVLTAYPFRPQLLAESRLAPTLQWGSRALVVVMPGDLEQNFSSGLARIGKDLK